MNRLLIIGAGMATARLLQELENQPHGWQVTVLGEEQRACYNRIALSSLLADEGGESDLDLLEPDGSGRNDVHLVTGEQALHIDTVERCVRGSSGRDWPYDALVLATGSSACKPAISGIQAGNVLALRNLEDLERIRKLAVPGSRGVVIGGGLLGLEAAAGLTRRGVECRVLNRGAWLMPRQLDEMGGLYLQRSLQAMGMHFELSSEPAAIMTEGGRAHAVELVDGRRFDCDLVLVAAGIEPNIRLAREAGLECRQGVVVNGLLQSSAPDVYALGECCEIEGRCFGLVEPVHDQAGVLARVLAGRKTGVFRYRESPVQLKVAGIQVAAAGRLPFPGDADSQLLTDPVRGVYRRLVFHENRLLGYVLVGDSRHSAWYREVMESGAAPLAPMMFGRGTGTDGEPFQEAIRNE